MKTVKIADLKDHLSEHLREVERGAEVVVTDRSRPIARIVPIASSRPSVQMVPPTRDFLLIRDRERIPAHWERSSTDLLLEERDER